MRARTHLAPGGTKYELQRVGSRASKVQWLSQSIYIIPPSWRFCTENRVIISPSAGWGDISKIVLTLIKRALISKHRYPSSHVNHANDTRNERTSGRSRFISTIYIIYAHQTCVKCILQYVRYDLLQRAVTRDCAKKKSEKAERPRKNEKKKNRWTLRNFFRINDISFPIGNGRVIQWFPNRAQFCISQCRSILLSKYTVSTRDY